MITSFLPKQKSAHGFGDAVAHGNGKPLNAECAANFCVGDDVIFRQLDETFPIKRQVQSRSRGGGEAHERGGNAQNPHAPTERGAHRFDKRIR